MSDTPRPFAKPRRARRFARAALAGVIAVAGTTAAHAAPSFVVSFDASASGLTTTERNNITSHVQAAGRAWANALAIRTSPSIEVLVKVGSVPTANAASVTTQFYGTVSGRATYEQGVAYELRTGTDPNGATADAEILFGLDYLRNELWFDPNPDARTAVVPATKTDAMSVALHELGHALAYNGWANLNTGAPTQAYWSLFDSYIIAGASPRFDGYFAVNAWGSAPELTRGNINHWGNGNAFAPPDASTHEFCDTPPVAWRNGAPVPLMCGVPRSADPPARRDGAAPAATLIDELMNGVVFYRGQRYSISPLDQALMRDVNLSNDAVFDNGFELLM